MTPLRLRIRELREAMGLSQQGLADAAGVRQGTISKLESGATKGVDFATLEKLAVVFKVEPGSLIERATKARKRK